jgi:biopolymer transport protein ExbD
MQFKEKTYSDAHLDITPIVDTVFNLLIFFALSLNFIVTPRIKVNLPESSTEEIVREKEEIVIVIKQGNEIFINNGSVSIEQLFLILSESAQRNRETLIIIQADKEVSHGRVVKVMDTAKRAGLTRLAIATIVMKETIAKGR